MKSARFNVLGAGALLGAAFVYAVFSVLIREMEDVWGDYSQVAARFLVAFLLLAVYGYVRKTKATIPRDKVPVTLACGFAFTLTAILFTLAILNTTIANTLFMTYAGSILSAFVIGTLVLHEKINGRKIVSILLALSGLALYSQAILTLDTGVVLALLAGIMDGVANFLRKSLSGVDRNAALKPQFAIGAAFAAVVALISSEPIVRDLTVSGVLLTVVYGVLIVGLANLLLYGFQYFDLNVGTVILSMELVFAVILGLVIYAEKPEVNEIIGGSLIFAASILSSLSIPKVSLKRQTI